MNPQEQLKEVQTVLDRLTKFRYINGWAAVVAGILAIIGFGVISYFFRFHPLHMETTIQEQDGIGWNLMIIFGYLLICTGVICGLIVLVTLPRDLSRHGFNNLIRLIGTLSLYIIGGGMVAFRILLPEKPIMIEHLLLMPAFMCILYGLALMHISQFSDQVLKYAGLFIFICGIAATISLPYSWLLWVVAFGGGHIVVGFFMIRKKKSE